jgi:hypothetical protein
MSRNLDRESKVFKSIGEHLSSGYALTSQDIREIYVLHGYKPNNAIGFTSAKGSEKFTELTGIAVRKDRIPTTKQGAKPIVYTDQALDHSETDIEEVKAGITGERIPEPTYSVENHSKKTTSGFLTNEQIAEISALHDLAFTSGLNYVIEGIPGKMPIVSMWKRASVNNSPRA